MQNLKYYINTIHLKCKTTVIFYRGVWHYYTSCSNVFINPKITLYFQYQCIYSYLLFCLKPATTISTANLTNNAHVAIFIFSLLWKLLGSRWRVPLDFTWDLRWHWFSRSSLIIGKVPIDSARPIFQKFCSVSQMMLHIQCRECICIWCNCGCMFIIVQLFL